MSEDVLPPISRFLLIFDNETRRLVGKLQVFPESEAIAALDAYDAAEDVYAGRRNRFEVVLVGAESIESVMVTHGRFFRDDNDE